jgi:hypothetical protein
MYVCDRGVGTPFGQCSRTRAFFTPTSVGSVRVPAEYPSGLFTPAIPANWSSARQTPDKRGGLNRSMQHQLEVYLAEFKGQIRLRASIQRKPCPDLI